MKKLLCVFLCLMLLVSSALAEGAPRVLTEDDPAYAWICEKSTELAALLDEALRSDGYLSIYFPQDQFGGELANLRKHDFSHPAATAILRADDAFLEQIANQFGPTMLNSLGLSESLESSVRRTVWLSVGNLLIGSMVSADMLALSSALTFSDAYICPDTIDGPCLAVMRCGGSYAFLAVFVPNGEGAVLARGQFIPSWLADILIAPHD